jgi:hypothetical protein
MSPTYAKRQSAEFQVYCIPPSETMVRLPQAWADADQAKDFGLQRAAEMFPEERVEVVVINVMTREAVRNEFTKGGGR